MSDTARLDVVSAMTLRIGLDGREPPTGFVFPEKGVGVPFEGWLELMHAISRLIGGGHSTDMDQEHAARGGAIIGEVVE